MLNQWDFGGQPATGVVQDGQAAEDSGPGSDAAGGGATGTLPGQGSGEGSDELETLVERVLERLGSVVDTRLSSMRQDLGTEIQRQVQSFSDRTAHRLSQQQRERLTALDGALDGLQEMLGPDFAQVKRQKQLDILLDTGAGYGEAGQSPASSGQQPAAGQSEPSQTREPHQSGDFAQVYLAQKLGAPSEWTPEEQAAIQRDLSQARDMVAWMAAVEGYAGKRAGRQRGDGEQGGESATEAPRGPGQRAARAQPVGAEAGRRPIASLEQLRDAYNRAVADGDMDGVNKLGPQIDAALNKLKV